MKGKIIYNIIDKYSGTFLTFLIFSFLVFPAISFAADPSIASNETVANAAAGTDDQTNVTATTTANVVEVKASSTLTIGALPGNTETITIGTCVVTFASSTGLTYDELNCTDNVAAVDRDTGTGNTARIATDIAGVLRTLTNLSDTGHGTLAITGSGANAVFTTSGTEASSTTISFTDGTAGDITLTASTTGVVPIAQVNTITIGGTVGTGDVFTVTLPTVGAVTYTVLGSDTTTANIATGLNASILASVGYAGQAFTSATSTNTVVLTAKVPGTGFTQTSTTTNRSATAQVVVFTPSNLTSGWELTITINGTNYSYKQTSGDTTKTVVEALQALVTANAAVGCTENDTAITCTAASAGTAFTYSTSVSAPPSSSSSGGGRVNYVCKDEDASNYESHGRHKESLCEFVTPSAPQASATVQEKIAELIFQNRALFLRAQKAGITLPPIVLSLLGLPSSEESTKKTMIDVPVIDLELGSTGIEVRELQQFLNSKGFTVATTGAGSPGNETLLFGLLTQSALVAYQSANGIYPASGYFGPITRAQIKASGR